MSKQTKLLWNYIIKHILSGTQLTVKQQDLASLRNINNFGSKTDNWWPQCHLFTLKDCHPLQLIIYLFRLTKHEFLAIMQSFSMQPVPWVERSVVRVNQLAEQQQIMPCAKTVVWKSSHLCGSIKYPYPLWGALLEIPKRGVSERKTLKGKYEPKPQFLEGWESSNQNTHCGRVWIFSETHLFRRICNTDNTSKDSFTNYCNSYPIHQI